MSERQLMVLTALGRDQAGIVAAVTRVLYEKGCNLEDSSMTRLAGEFAMLVVFQAKPGVSVEALQSAFDAVARKFSLTVHLKALSAREAERPSAAGEPHVISVYGADQPGLVYKVTRLLAENQVNITDVTTRRTGEGSPTIVPLYQLILEVEVPAAVSRIQLENRLRDLADSLGVQVAFSPLETVEL